MHVHCSMFIHYFIHCVYDFFLSKIESLHKRQILSKFKKNQMTNDLPYQHYKNIVTMNCVALEFFCYYNFSNVNF